MASPALENSRSTSVEVGGGVRYLGGPNKITIEIGENVQN